MTVRATLHAAMLSAAVMLASCVHEMPEDSRRERAVTLSVHHDKDWDRYEQTVSRADDPRYAARYHFQIFKADDPGKPVREVEFTRGDVTRGDFSTTLPMPPGDYVLHAWSDWADKDSKESYFFDSSDFANIVYTEPYNGNNELRDAFRGVTSFTVEETLDAEYSVVASLNMERPLARYEFISTDLVEFLEGEASRGRFSFSRGDSPADIPSRVPDFGDYTVKMIYTGYMPSVFNNLTNKPVDSATGMSYEARIDILNDSEARLGFDYVMVNGHESSVAVALEIYDPDGALIGRVSPVDVSTKRSRNTVVKGRFLTSKATGGVGINPGFDGEFNIEIK